MEDVMPHAADPTERRQAGWAAAWPNASPKGCQDTLASFAGGSCGSVTPLGAEGMADGVVEARLNGTKRCMLPSCLHVDQGSSPRL
jgi:hypothetical protein